MAVSLSLKKARATFQFGGAAYTPPATYYFGLLSNNGDYPSYTVTELTGTGYARVPVPNDAAHWTEPDENGVVYNKQRITWAAVPAAEDWDEVKGLGIYDVPTGGQPLYTTSIYLNTPMVEEVRLMLKKEGFSYREY